MRHAARATLLGLVVLLACPGLAPAAVSGAGSLFPLPAELRPAFAFWTDIYARHGSDQTVLHDSERLEVVYGVLDFSELAGAPMSAWQRERTRANAEELEKERIRNLLRDIALYADSPERLTPEQKRIFDLFPDDGPRVLGARFLDAADRVRAQVGQRDRFRDGIRTAGRYMSEIERIFEAEGVPVELARLAFVESMFNLSARSAVGASGVWQFIRPTARLYLRVDDLVDERNDPLLAARAAARLLADNYADLGTWPLAVTAYNHGRQGMRRAVAEVGSRDIARVLAEYRGPSFGFASRNFYAEFLAALHVERNARRYFGPVEILEPDHYDLVAMPGHATVADLARHAGLEVGNVKALNPGLSDRALRGARPLPKGYALRVPADRRPRLVAAKYAVRPGWRPRVALAAGAKPKTPPAVHAAASVGPALGPLALNRAEQMNRLAPPAPHLDPELHRAQVMAQEEEALGLFLAVSDAPKAREASEPAGVPREADAGSSREPARVPREADGAPPEPEAGRADVPTAPVGVEARVALARAAPAPLPRGLRASPPEAAGDRLVDAAVEALEASALPATPAMVTPGGGERDDEVAMVRPGARVVPSVTTAAGTFRTTVRGGETVWRLAEWSGEPLEAFRSRNRLVADQPLPAGRAVAVSTAAVDRETFESRRAAFHQSVRDRAAREFTVVGTRPHRMQPGETPWRLAQTHGIPFWLLEQTNPERELAAVQAGDTLLVPVVRRP